MQVLTVRAGVSRGDGGQRAGAERGLELALLPCEEME